MFCSTSQQSIVTYSVSKKSKVTPSKRTKKDYFAMIKAVKRGYFQLSPKDKFVYEIFTEYDYQDKSTGLCKGFIYPSFERIEEDYGIKTNTLYRSYRKLEKAGLVKRQRRMNTNSKIYLLDLPDKQLSTKQNEGQLSKVPNAINRINEKNRRFATRLDFVKAMSEEAVTRLIAYGYDPKAAVRDCLTFGAQELETQLDNLTLLTLHGGIIRDPARWLNFGIHHHRRIDPAQLKSELDIDKLYKALSKTSHALPPLEERMELVEDEYGYTYYREKESISLVDRKHAISDSMKSESTVVPSEPCIDVNPTSTNYHDYSAYVPHSSPICASFVLPSKGGGYYCFENADLPQPRAPARSSPADACATRPPFHRFAKTHYIRFCNGGLVDRSGRELCCVCDVICEKECEKRKRTQRVRREMRRRSSSRSRVGEGSELGNTDWKKREAKLLLVEIVLSTNYFKGELYCMELRRIHPIRVQKKQVARKNRKTRIDKNEIPLTDRDLTVLTWIGEMYLARFDQVKVLLERNTQCAQGDNQMSLSAHAVRKVILRWLRRGVVGYKKILAYQSGYVWLTSRGLREMGFKETELTYRDWEPRPTTIEHYYMVNRVRLYYEKDKKETFHWMSERTLRARKGNRKGHDADAELFDDNKLFALEVELSTKSPEDTKAIMRTLLRERVERNVYKYAKALYVTNAKTTSLITRTKESLPLEDQQRIEVQSVFDYL